MTKKQITEYLILFVLGLIITIGFVNPISKKYTWWNAIHITKDLYNQQRATKMKIDLHKEQTIFNHLDLKMLKIALENSKHYKENKNFLIFIMKQRYQRN